MGLLRGRRRGGGWRRFCRFGRFGGCGGFGVGGRQHGFDFGGLELEVVQQHEGGLRALAAEGFADALAHLLDRPGQIVRQGSPLLDQELVRFGERAPASAGNLYIGGALGGLPVRMVVRDSADRAGDFPEVPDQDFGKDAFDIEIIEPDRSRHHAQGEGDFGDGKNIFGEAGHQGLGGGDDTLLPLPLFFGEREAAEPVFHMGAVDAGGGLHGGCRLGTFGECCQGVFNAIYEWFGCRCGVEVVG